MTVDELAQWVEKEKINLIFPGMYEWQNDDCYTAYKNYEPPGCEMAESKNPVLALVELHNKIDKQPEDCCNRNDMIENHAPGCKNEKTK